MASDSRDYGSPEYWDQFYKSSGGDGVREWFHGFELLRELFERHLRRTDRILMVGCGNSALSADMFAAGYENIVNIDASMVVIRQMLRRQPEMDWRHMDECNMAEFRTGSFDAVIDKGTLDAILVRRHHRHHRCYSQLAAAISLAGEHSAVRLPPPRVAT